VLICGSNNNCNTQNGTFYKNNELTNAVQARHMYQEQFPNRRIPNIRTIVRVVQHLRDHVFYKPQTQDRGGQRPDRVAKMRQDIWGNVENQRTLNQTF
jgi:hypothetical protein